MQSRWIIGIGIVVVMVAVSFVQAQAKSEQAALELLEKTLLQDPQACHRQAAAIALGRSQRIEAMHLLLKALDEEEDPAVRIDIVKAMGMLREPMLVRYLLEEFHKSNNYDFCLTVVNSLGQIGMRTACTLLRQLAMEPWATGDDLASTWDLRIPAIKALGLIADRRGGTIIMKDLAAHPEKRTPQILLTAAWALAKMRKRRGYRYFQKFGRGDLYDVCRLIAGERQLLDKLLPKLGTLKFTSDVVEAIGWYRMAQARTQLENLLPPRGKGDNNLYRKVAWALGQLHDHRSIAPLNKAFEACQNFTVRLAILEALAKMGCEEAREIIRKIATNDKFKVAAIAVLARAGGNALKEALPRLRRLLKKGSEEDQLHTLWALAGLKDRQSVPLMENLLSYPNIYMRLNAAAMLLLVLKE